MIFQIDIYNNLNLFIFKMLKTQFQNLYMPNKIIKWIKINIIQIILKIYYKKQNRINIYNFFPYNKFKGNKKYYFKYQNYKLYYYNLYFLVYICYKFQKIINNIYKNQIKQQLLKKKNGKKRSNQKERLRNYSYRQRLRQDNWNRLKE
ncbi:hypothetical protein IMG5_156400 [Ichthyophthirius multifiliis]|uniref:Uncharacterized protein n=1 Tax=Ichthyophthirius multifiliis TaxID=5932 RepID=G0QZG0_ICHMU|nr:hypothetical protein IMG5_156400 [Ichthyophthirius multifiliis]EGR29398.1 hypothetical protein IMG5_156400 [Ichthyophthirius multifiliis]|eukprot:XP_004030634.1 hypothetical protein IMG5_156400 [Ichthyophthirius multifiliis]